MIQESMLNGSEFTYTVRRASLSQFLEINFEGLGAIEEDEATTFYTILLSDRKIGTIWQNEDGTWTASPFKEDISQERDRPTASGFAHELYAAKYLKDIAARVGLLSGTNHVFELDLNEGRTTILLGIGEEVWGHIEYPVTKVGTDYQAYGSVKRTDIDSYVAKIGGRADGTGFEDTYNTIQKALKAAQLPVIGSASAEPMGKGIYKLRTKFDS